MHMASQQRVSTDLPDDMPFVGRVARHARVMPEATAVTDGCRHLSYAELWNEASRLADGLRERGVQPGDAIMVRLPPGAEVLIALLAIHRLGGIYVPVDVATPVRLLARMGEVVKPRLVIQERAGIDIPDSLAQRVQTLDGLCLRDVPARLDVLPSLEQPSHVFFTSGTTGRPKAVLSSQRNLSHYIRAAVSRFGFGREDSFLAVARLSFSISFFELLVPLAVGGRVHILPREAVLHPQRLARALEGVSVFHFGPALLKRLFAYLDETDSRFDFSRIRHASSGGDFVSKAVVERMLRYFPAADVAVMYGSTEINCMGCSFHVPRTRCLDRVVVGRPLPGVTLQLRDAQERPVEAGEIGQVFMGGEGVALGYAGDPALTAERFTTARDGERFYAMGDLGRFTPEGDLELLGRKDFQVKIRGMRVELPAVEECLRAHPAVADCVVVGRRCAGQAERSLVAYVVAASGNAAAVTDLARHAAAELPDFMVPSRFVCIERLPLNFNGKVDRDALPDPEGRPLILSRGHVPPRTGTERRIAEYWQAQLGAGEVGIDDSFFERGGDSLAAVSLLAWLEETFGRFISISHFMAHPTIRELAEAVEQGVEPAEDREVVVLRKGDPAQPPLFCLYGVMLYRDLARNLNTRRMVCGVYVREEVELLRHGRTAVMQGWSVDGIADRYLRILREFQPRGPYFLCGESFGGVIALEVARRLREAGERVELVAMLDSIAPGYYRALPMWRRIAAHLRLAPARLCAWLRGRGCAAASVAAGALEDLREEVRHAAFRAYRPAVYGGRVLLFRARQRGAFDPGLPDLGWRVWLPRLIVHEVDGDHLGILRPGHVETLAATLSRCMAVERVATFATTGE